MAGNRGEPGRQGRGSPSATATRVRCACAVVLCLLSAPHAAPAQTFVLRTQSAGLSTVIGTNGVAVADFDKDGDLDLYFVAQDTFKQNDKRTWNRLFANNGDGTFQDVTTRSGIAARSTTSPFSYMGYKMGASWGDYDNDGFPDLYVTNLGTNQLFHNNGDGTFADVTAQSGLGRTGAQLSSSAVWFDADRDGDLDLYVCVWADYGPMPRDTRNRMYENLGNGAFRDVSDSSGLGDAHLTWTAVAVDADNDGHPDLYLANDFGPTQLYVNDRDGTFRERTTEFGLDGNFQGMGLAVGDCDGNGYFDIYLTNVTESGSPGQMNPLYLNGGNGLYAKVFDAGVSTAGWGWGTEFFDLENDGDEDLFVVNGYFSQVYTKRLFRNDTGPAGVRFQEIAHDVGLVDSAEGRGLAVADFNNDGRLDILISHFTRAASLYENQVSWGHWLAIDLEGTVSNRCGFGAVVDVSVGGKSIRKYHHGAQFLGQNIVPVHVGLGQAQLADKVTVTWPSGIVDVIDSVQADQRIRIRENTGIVNGIRRAQSPAAIQPGPLTLSGNYPNPFNGSTEIRFTLHRPGEILIEIFTVSGRRVRTFREFYQEPGEKSVRWSVAEGETGVLTSGVYVYRIRTSHGAVQAGKMLLVR